MKNINTESDFKDRTGLVVWLKSKRNIKRLMSFGVLHYVSSKMDYAILYVNADDVDEAIKRIKKENYVKSVEISHLRDLPATYDDVLETMRKEIEEKKKDKELDVFSNQMDFTQNDW